MNTDDMHPDTETLIAYCQDPAASEFSALRLHLASCASCRDEVSTLALLDTHYVSLPTSDVPAQQDQAIRDFVDDKLDKVSRSTIESLMQTNPGAMKAALHYASHSATMEAELGSSEATVARAQDPISVSLASRLYHSLMRLAASRPPIWAVIPATAMAVALMTVGLLHSVSTSEPNISVASYQDNPVMQFRKHADLPGIGFFSKADQYTKAYTHVEASLLEPDQIRIDWPKVDKALSYTLRLQMFRQNQKINLGEVSTETPGATFNIEAAVNGQRYEWVLTGMTQDEQTFYASGGFVINRNN